MKRAPKLTLGTLLDVAIAMVESELKATRKHTREVNRCTAELCCMRKQAKEA
jgi:hypothetical protein